MVEWIQAKYGIAILFAGILAMAMDHVNTHLYFTGPIIGGMTIALLALLSKRLGRYHYTPLQFNNGIFLFMFYWAGALIVAIRAQLHCVGGLPTAMIFCTLAVCCLSYLAIFFTSCTYQDEIDEIEKEAHEYQKQRN